MLFHSVVRPRHAVQTTATAGTEKHGRQPAGTRRAASHRPGVPRRRRAGAGGTPLPGRGAGRPPGRDALLCVSELATNAVLHSRSGRPGGRFAVRAAVRAGRVRVEVEDEGGPWRPGGGQTGQSGRGLAIVGRLASRWGRDDRGDRRTVWFEIDW